MDQGREFRFVAEKAYSIPGRGIVVTGRVERGRVSVGDAVGFLGADGQYVSGPVDAIEVSRQLVEAAEAGQTASLLLQGVRKGQIVTGTVLTAAPEAPPVPVAPSPTVTVPSPVTTSPSAPSVPSSAEPIHPPSTLGRTVFFIIIGVIILAMLFFAQGKWDPKKLDPKKWDPRRWDPRKKVTVIQEMVVDTQPFAIYNKILPLPPPFPFGDLSTRNPKPKT